MTARLMMTAKQATKASKHCGLSSVSSDQYEFREPLGSFQGSNIENIGLTSRGEQDVLVTARCILAGPPSPSYIWDMPPVIEMRTYQTKPGKRSEFLRIFTTRSIPAHREIGMKVIGPFLSIEDPDTFFFMRAFPDLESREPMKSRFYDGLLWKGELESVLMPMLEKYDVVLVEDTQGLLRDWSP
jgi:hypothetical protein